MQDGHVCITIVESQDFLSEVLLSQVKWTYLLQYRMHVTLQSMTKITETETCCYEGFVSGMERPKDKEQLLPLLTPLLIKETLGAIRKAI